MQRPDRSLIVNPRMARGLRNVFNSTLTIGVYNVVNDTYNQPIDFEFVPSTSPMLAAIPCYREPLSDQEARKNNQVVITDKYVVALQGYFPQITVEDFARIDEVIYNITGVTSDDTKTITFLNVQIVNKSVDNNVNG